jgi:uncharacterized protein with HEPN domain
MRTDDATLLDIARALRRIRQFVEGFDRERFEDDERTQSAVLHQLLVLGEAVKRLSATFRAVHADIPWRLIAGMRDRLIHGYDTVDLDEVWHAATIRVPEVAERLAPVLPSQQG